MSPSSAASRARGPRDLEVAWDAVKGAKRPRVHTFIATSKIHMEHKLRMSEDQVVENAVSAVKHLKSLGCDDIEFSPEDAGRSEPALPLPGAGRGHQGRGDDPQHPGHDGLVHAARVRRADRGPQGQHARRRLGGLVDALPERPGPRDGQLARGRDGGGEADRVDDQRDRRAGREREPRGGRDGAGQARRRRRAPRRRRRRRGVARHAAPGALRTGVRPVHITATSRMVCDYSGMPVQPHKAIVGPTPSRTSRGSTRTACLNRGPRTRSFRPEEIGLLRADGDAGIVLGKHSGRAALRSRLSELGFDLEGAALDDFFKRFKSLADSRKRVSDEDVLALLADEVHQPTKAWELRALQVVCGTGGMPTATARLLGPDGIVRSAAATGTGPVDAAYKAIDSLVRVPVALSEFSVQSVTEGIEALAATRVTVRPAGGLANEGFVESARGGQVQRSFTGSGTCEDIVVASARAYVSALNKVIARLSAESEAARRAGGEESGSEVEEGARATAGAA